MRPGVCPQDGTCNRSTNKHAKTDGSKSLPQACTDQRSVRREKHQDGWRQGHVDAREEAVQDSSSNDAGLAVHTDEAEGDNRSDEGARNYGVENPKLVGEYVGQQSAKYRRRIENR